MIEPEDDGCGDADGGHEAVSASVVAGVDAAPVLEPSEHDLDLVAPPVECGVVGDRHLAVHLRRDVGGDTALGQGRAKPVDVVTSVAKKGCGLRGTGPP